MSHILSRRNMVRFTTYLLALLLLLLGAVYRQNRSLARYRRLASNSSVHAFSELSASMDKMAACLEKETCVTTPAQIAALSTEIYGQSHAARQAIGELPYADVELEQTASFVTRVGDYAQAVSRSAAAHGGFTGDERKNLGALAKTARTLAGTLDRMEGRLYSGSLTLEDLEAAERRLSGTGKSEGGESRFKAVEADFPELPTLIYDGPFSDSLQSKTAKGLRGLKKVTRTRARRLAADFLRVNPDILENAGEIAGDVPVWVFRTRGEKGTCTVRVTKRGGKILNMLCSRPVGAAAVSREEAVERAGKYLSDRGYKNLTENYYSEAEGTLTVNFTAVQGEVLLYPDLIKVEVALDTGEVVGFEGEHYLTHHVPRKLAKPSVTAEEAKKRVSDALEVRNTRLALIPTPGENEVLCWECNCRTGEGRRCMVYINAETGAEEQVLLLQEDESGTLVV